MATRLSAIPILLAMGLAASPAIPAQPGCEYYLSEEQKGFEARGYVIHEIQHPKRFVDSLLAAFGPQDIPEHDGLYLVYRADLPNTALLFVNQGCIVGYATLTPEMQKRMAGRKA